MAFVAHNVPDVCSDGGGVAPVAPLAANAFAPPGGFERVERFATDEGTAPDRGEQQQDIGGQMRQFLVAGLIQSPTARDFLIVESPVGIIGSQILAGGFEFVNLATRARLMPIHASGI